MACGRGLAQTDCPEASGRHLLAGGVLPGQRLLAAVDGATGNVVTFDGSTWTAPVNVDSKAAKSVSGPVLMFLMSVSCRSAAFCVAGDSTGDVFVRS